MKILLFIILIAIPFSSFADNKDGLSKYKLAKQLYLDDKVLESFQMFLIAAKKGNAQAQYQMGWMLSNKHKGITRDKSKAMLWYECLYDDCH